jgi:hypothetical protein
MFSPPPAFGKALLAAARRARTGGRRMMIFAVRNNCSDFSLALEAVAADTLEFCCNAIEETT